MCNQTLRTRWIHARSSFYRHGSSSQKGTTVALYVISENFSTNARIQSTKRLGVDSVLGLRIRSLNDVYTSYLFTSLACMGIDIPICLAALKHFRRMWDLKPRYSRYDGESQYTEYWTRFQKILMISKTGTKVSGWLIPICFTRGGVCSLRTKTKHDTNLNIMNDMRTVLEPNLELIEAETYITFGKQVLVLLSSYSAFTHDTDVCVHTINQNKVLHNSVHHLHAPQPQKHPCPLTTNIFLSMGQCS